MSQSKLVKSASILMIITLISKVVGFFRDALTANAFGATYSTDAYNMAVTIPNILFATFSLAIATTFIPILTESLKTKGKEEMFDFANNIMNVITIISIIFGIVGWIFADKIVFLMAPKFSGETYNLTVFLTKLCIINIVFMSLNSGFTAILQTLEDFLAPSLVGIMMNLPIIFYILLVPNKSIFGLTIATIIGKLLEVLIQIPWVLKHGYRFKFFINLKDERIKRILILVIPVIIGTGVNQLNAIVDKAIASGLREGTISALDYATKVNGMVYSVFGMAVITIVYPMLSQAATNHDLSDYKGYLNKAVNSINVIMIPTTVGLVLLNEPIINVIFRHGAFDDVAANMTSTALIYYALGITFYGIRDVLSRGFYALNDTKTPMINGAIGVIVNIACNLIITRYMGIGGVALSTSIAAVSTTLLLGYNLSKKVDGLNSKNMIYKGLKILMASLIMGVGIYLINKMLPSNMMSTNLGSLIILVVSGILGILTYIFIIYKLKVEEANEIIKKLIKK
ncbi:putative peptidoglycan lipid II flippase [Clostridium cavendishii DSM 21758]|uniref:Probable lipid II flippase MurJ n=1 Tax=Clostridium cavendishii DSM 21758 TaxID=1121302 RepID=A0A1M6Q6P7_9CLOT|nr:murein biosynthesis integral membrane protein MurJ [Clostridium cavendishii]SHK15797.1 putative peptidoglycan lipid II flippase [Clostridium cavendishii DSM 21758]